MGNGLAAFTAGLGSGYLNASRQAKLDAQGDEDRAMRKQEFDAKMDDVNQAKSLRLSLADAARPIGVQQGAGGSVRPDSMDNRDVGLPENADLPNGGLTLGNYKVAGKGYQDASTADAAAAAQNTPDAIAKRQGQAYRLAGQPGQALDIEQKQAAITGAQITQAKKIKEEGFIDAARASRTGDPQAVFDAFNKSGTMKLTGMPTVTPVERELPGIGKVTTYDYSGQVIGPDGQPKDVKVNSHDFSMQTLPFEKALELQRKGTDSDNKATYQQGMIDNKIKQLELTGQIAEAKAMRAAAGGGSVGREERLRFTSLFSDSGRRVGETQKAIGALQRDIMFMTNARKPDSPEAQQLSELQNNLKQHNEERQMYQGLLAGSSNSAPAEKLSLSDAIKPAASNGPKQVTSAADRDALPKGTRYTAPNGQQYIKQ